MKSRIRFLGLALGILIVLSGFPFFFLTLFAEMKQQGIENYQAVTGGGCSIGLLPSQPMNPFGSLLMFLTPIVFLEISRRTLITQADVDGWFKDLSFSLEF